MYCDSKSAIAISCNPVHHSKTKHIKVRYHFIKEHVEEGTVELFFVKTVYQLADLFTKALPKERFDYLVRRIGMRSLTPEELERLLESSWKCFQNRFAVNIFEKTKYKIWKTNKNKIQKYKIYKKIQKQYKIKKSKNILLTTCLSYKSIFCTFLEMSFNNDTDMYRCLSGSSLKCFSKTCRFSKVSSQWLSYTSVRNPDFNDDFWLFSNQGLVRSMTNSFSKSSSLKKLKIFQA